MQICTRHLLKQYLNKVSISQIYGNSRCLLQIRTTNLCIRSGTIVSHADICRAKSARAMASWGMMGGKREAS